MSPESMAQIKRGSVQKGVMTRKREPRVPKATCCSLALARLECVCVRMCVVVGVLAVHLHTVCTGKSDYFDDLLTRREPTSTRLPTSSPPLTTSHIYPAGKASRKKGQNQTKGRVGGQTWSRRGGTIQTDPPGSTQKPAVTTRLASPLSRHSCQMTDFQVSLSSGGGNLRRNRSQTQRRPGGSDGVDSRSQTLHQN